MKLARSPRAAHTAYLALAGLLAAGLLVLSCSSPSSPPSGTPTGAAIAPLSEVERTRSVEACDAYVAALCGCAKAKPELQATCDLDLSLQQGVSHMLTVEGSVRDTEKRKMAQHQLRRMTATCVERLAQLPAQGCPSAVP